MSHFIYVRQNKEQLDRCAIKVCLTTNIIARDYQYKTNEISSGIFLGIFNILNMEDDKQLVLLEKSIHYRLDKIPDSVGTEIFYYTENSIDIIKQCIDDLGYRFRQIEQNSEEYKSLKKDYDSNRFCDDYLKDFKLFALRNKHINLYQYQKTTYNKLIKHYESNHKAFINYACGLGKTILSCYYLQQTQPDTTIIGVPSLLLREQWYKEIKKYFSNNILLIGTTNTNNRHITTEPDRIKHFLSSNEPLKVVITTYHSSHLLEEYSFDCKINDEVHHLADVIAKNEHLTNNTNKGFGNMMKINGNKELSLSATLKTIEYDKNVNKTIISNDDEKLFGKVIDSISVNTAIDMGRLCDYKVVVNKMNANSIEELFDSYGISISLMDVDIVSNYKLHRLHKLYQLLLGAYMSCYAILQGQSKKLIIYTNNIKNAKIVQNLIDTILNKTMEYTDNIYNNIITSDINTLERQTIMEKFRTSEKAILTSVYVFTEGIDIPYLDTVVFAENMSSVIRIVQSSLRPHRKDPNNKDKLAYILLPIYIDDDFEKNDNNDGFGKIKKLISHLGNNDTNLEDRIVVKDCKYIPFQKPIKNKKKRDLIMKIDVKNDEEWNNKLKIRLLNRKCLKGNIFNNYKTIVNQVSKRDKKLSCCENYQKIEKKILKLNGLPSWKEMNVELEKKKHKWYELYNIDYSKCPVWTEFKKQFGKLYDKEKYIYLSQNTLNFNYPLYPDLEEVYGEFGYNMDFWENTYNYRYRCDRCGYNTVYKTHYITHINRKNICKSIDDNSNVDIYQLYKKYNIPFDENNISPLWKEYIKTKDIETINMKKYITCQYCDKKFSRKYSLKRHLIKCLDNTKIMDKLLEKTDTQLIEIKDKQDKIELVNTK